MRALAARQEISVSLLSPRTLVSTLRKRKGTRAAHVLPTSLPVFFHISYFSMLHLTSHRWLTLQKFLFRPLKCVTILPKNSAARDRNRRHTVLWSRSAFSRRDGIGQNFYRRGARVQLRGTAVPSQGRTPFQLSTPGLSYEKRPRNESHRNPAASKEAKLNES